MDMISLKALMVGNWQAVDSVLPVVSVAEVVHASQAEKQFLYQVGESAIAGAAGGGTGGCSLR
jgi:hypothetical protein